jgi:phenylacetate-CoA ligase
MAEHYDALEARDPAVRERDLFTALPAFIRHAKAAAPGWERILVDVDPTEIADRGALARLPITRKSELAGLQTHSSPFGGLTTVPIGGLGRVFVSPGPLYDPEGRELDYWRMARALYAAGFRMGDLIHNTFSYHLTPAGSMLESGAHALGCAVIPAGGGQTEQQVSVIAALKPTGYTGTPSFLRILLEKAADLRQDVTSLRKALVSAEALPPSLRQSIAELGVHAFQCYASADLGLIAYESKAMEGMIVDEGVIVEIVRPGTGDPVPDGEVGEIVVTTLNRTYPLIRFGTGDLSAVLPGRSPCGRTNTRIRGWMGRADQRTKVRGRFVTPEQIAEIVRRHPDIKRARLVVTNPDNRDTMTLRCETEGHGEARVESLVSTLQNLTQLRGEVVLVPVGSLANDGKVIEDARTHA